MAMSHVSLTNGSKKMSRNAGRIIKVSSEKSLGFPNFSSAFGKKNSEKKIREWRLSPEKFDPATGVTPLTT